MFKTAPRSLLPAALLSALVGLAGCHISIGSGSSSPNHVHGKPARHSSSSSSKSSRSSTTSKPIKKSTKTSDPEPTSDAPSDKATEGPHRDKPDTTDPKRTLPSDEPSRTEPSSDPSRTPSDPTRTKHLGNKDQNGGEAPDDAGGDDAGGANPVARPDRPGSLITPKRETGGAKEISQPGSLTAPK